MNEYDGTWEAEIERLIERGYLDDEIEDSFDRRHRQSLELDKWDPLLSFPSRLTRSGESLYWGELRGRRRIVALIADVRRASGDARDEVTEAQVRAKLEELKAAGKDHGADSIAKALNTSPSTVRRRLGRL